MDLQDGGETSAARFTAYGEAVADAHVHADGKAPLRAYCTGLILPGERKSVEPMAARVAPGRVAAAHQSLHPFVANANWSDEAVLGGCGRSCCRRSRAGGRSAPGWRMIPASPRRGPLRPAWRANIAGHWASRTIARARCACRWPATMPACPSPFASLCRRSGPRIRSAGPRRGCQRMSPSATPPRPAGRSSKQLHVPRIIDPAAPPLRPQRHVVHSIATLPMRPARALARRRPRCP